jgi:hypothetical protein
MFETLPNPSLEVVLIAGRALLLLGAFWIFAIAFIRWRRADDMNSSNLHAQIERTFAEVRSLHETIIVMGARIEALSERAELDARLAPVSSGGTQRGYDIATRLARNGADVSEIVANCGITRHEAELLLRLHGPQRSTAQPASRPVHAEAPLTNARPQNQRAPAPRSPATLNDEQRQSDEEREMLTRAAPQATGGRKRGSLLSVVG